MESSRTLAWLIAASCALAAITAVSARQCQPAGETCDLPDCLCPDWLPPANLDAATEVPQIVFLTFDDAITVSNYPLYNQTLFERTNPNGAKVTATFFITHEYNNYQLTHDLYRRGHGIALHSITHKTDTTYWSTLDEAGWAAEVCEQRQQMEYFASIPTGTIKGFRVPFLQLGGDRQFRTLASAQCGLEYDCSRPTRQYAGPTPFKLWPYTMDYDTQFQDCQNGPCPIGSYPGFWTVPMVSMYGDNGFPCAMVDTCIPQPTTATETYELLKKNFDNHYEVSVTGNRAPFGVFTHAAWLQGEDNAYRLEGYIQFLDYLKTKNDVYIVSIEKGLEWMKNPTPVEDVETFDPWTDKPMPPDQCNFAFPCEFRGAALPFPGERYMTSCKPCPAKYPWINNWRGDP